MITFVSRGDKPDRTTIETSTVYIIRRDIHEYTEEREEEVISGWEWTEIRLSPEEVASVRMGIPPQGHQWTDDLRRIERGQLLDDADRNIAKAQDYIAAGDEEWNEYLDQMHTYKMGVRDTVNQEGFPLSVIYPDVPQKPN